MVHNLTPQEIEQVESEEMPFSQNINIELRRLAYVITNSYKADIQNHMCTRELTRTETCIRKTCVVCKPQENYPLPLMRKIVCHSCRLPLLPSKSFYLVTCGHVICEQCLSHARVVVLEEDDTIALKKKTSYPSPDIFRGNS
ncbi:hypothetical protein Zmor_014930 [Zophobas morio]|uniref:RING-type domain-containing protein n=1 Tax=Zophobas morio TaxID=2755281 RepID=A0AA38MG37_9CUCU|nr:hypothetical protein Zmor_014930 [Zophobas morio]